MTKFNSVLENKDLFRSVTRIHIIRNLLVTVCPLRLEENFNIKHMYTHKSNLAVKQMQTLPS